MRRFNIKEKKNFDSSQIKIELRQFRIIFFYVIINFYHSKFSLEKIDIIILVYYICRLLYTYVLYMYISIINLFSAENVHIVFIFSNVFCSF